MKRCKLPSDNQVVDVVILANGSFPTHPIPLGILNNCKKIIACDGAANILIAKGYVVDAIVGDCDSLRSDLLQEYASIIHKDKNQETNDLTKTVSYCVSKGYTTVTILGATGKRDDHSIANIGLLTSFGEMDVMMVSDSGSFVAINAPCVFDSYKGQQISIFCLDYSPISVRNLLYPINNMTFNRWWQATLNESTHDFFEVEPSGATIVYREFTDM